MSNNEKCFKIIDSRLTNIQNIKDSIPLLSELLEHYVKAIGFHGASENKDVYMEMLGQIIQKEHEVKNQLQKNSVINEG